MLLLLLTHNVNAIFILCYNIRATQIYYIFHSVKDVSTAHYAVMPIIILLYNCQNSHTDKKLFPSTVVGTCYNKICSDLDIKTQVNT